MEISKILTNTVHGASKITSKAGLVKVFKLDGVKFTTTNGPHKFANLTVTLTSKLLNISPLMLNTTSSVTLKLPLVHSVDKLSPTLLSSIMLLDTMEHPALLRPRLMFFGTTL
jgi:hypothetical protein